MRVRPFYILLLIAVFMLASCKGKPAQKKGKYVVLSPETAEIIAALGAVDEIIGVSKECSYPPALKSKEIVGDFGAIDKEKVLNLSPQIVFSSGLEQEAIALDLKKLGINVYESYPQTVREMLDEIIKIGNLIGRDAQASALRDSIQIELDRIVQANKDTRRPTVYLEIYRDPLMSVADDSFVGELIELAGGNNAFDRLERDYSRVKAEAIIQANPDIMICYSHDSLQNVLNRKGWARIPAIAQKNIYFEKDIDPDLIQRAGPRILEGLRQLDEIFENWRLQSK
ncbi:MAG: helical backbone metal receptor [Candidatus Cloacimonetes bacterium]|nr:helical backbone metal receptor [Candidatus Cloacimonadota bacterium]